MAGLTHARIKTLRAEEHLKRLQREIGLFLGGKHIAITKQDDAKKGLHIVRFEQTGIPNEIPLLVGEFAYNLRSGLDQLAWQLALLSGRTPASETSFPIHRDRTERSEQRFRRVTWDIPCEAIQIIKSLQPYERGDDFERHPLWQLNKLCNIDKHATMPICCTELKIDTNIPVQAIYLDDGIEFHLPLAAKHKVDFKPRPPELVFGRPTNEPGPPFEIRIGDIAEIHEFVRDRVIPRFELFFP